MKKLITYFVIILVNLNLWGKQLSPAARLSKLSQSLTGKQASLTDQKFISSLSSQNDTESFLSQKADEYLSSQEYSTKLTSKIVELFQFNLPNSYNYIIPTTNRLVAPKTNATFSLFASLSKNNLSWDSILTGHDYTIFDTDFGAFADSITTDIGFYSNLINLPNSSVGYIKNLDEIGVQGSNKSVHISFEQNDLRIAGALTTPTFFERYNTTALNKNRRRAAAIFRIFFCDSMRAAIPDNSKIDPAIFDILYPKDTSTQNLTPENTGMTEAEIKAILVNNDSIHGTKKDCKQCHEKLDPMGHVFATSSASLGSSPSNGKLFYKNKENQQIDISVNGISELAQAITQQKEYLQCQIKHFWRWYIGEDVPLTPEKENELIQKFNSVGRKTNSFIKTLVLSKEFSERNISDEINNLSLQAKSFLNKCQACHQNSSDYLGPDLTKWPLGDDQNNPKDNHAYWLAKISKNLDLEHDGQKYKMPPPPSEGGFIPTRIELNLIKKWISSGGPIISN